MITILKSGLLDTLQDAGRFGHAAAGINNNGVMDYYAMQVANALVQNPPEEAVIEMHFPAPVLKFETAALVALCGADFSAYAGDVALPIHKPMLLPAGTILTFKKMLQGVRCYLTVRGGFALTSWLGSAATNLAAGMGGWNGQKLRKGDALPLRTVTSFDGETPVILPWRADTTSGYMDAHYLYYIKGPEAEWLDGSSQHRMVQEPFTVSGRSDRMAIRLIGEPLTCEKDMQMVSSGVTMGTIQLMPNGEIVVLMADHQTTGGYPRIGTIITAHLPKLAQARRGDYVHLLQVEQATAEELLFARSEELKILNMGCQFKLDAWRGKHPLTLNS